jgi:iron complex outermembrane recepter protein
MRRSLRKSLQAGVSLLAFAGPAWAAEPAPTEGVEEIVVTAQLREQKLQDVPISISAFNSDFINETGSQNVSDLQKYTPGLRVDSTSTTQPVFEIRGISTNDFGVGTDPSVGIFIDGVYSARSGEALIFFDDIDRVEVLKGPQGTLFGRNTAAGAISIVTNKPSDQFEGMVDFKTGNYGKEEGTIVLNVPITDTLAVRLDGIVNRRDGYTHNSFNGQDLNDEDNESTRLALRWHPDADTNFILAWDHDNTDVTPPTALGINPFSHNGGNPFGATYDDEIDGRETRILDDITLTGTEKFGDLLLTSISAYKFFKTTNLESETGSPDQDRYFDTENVENNHSFYQELRLNGTSGPFTFAGGGSYFDERAKQESKASATIASIDSTLTAAGVGPLFEELIGSPQLQSLLWNEQMDNIGQNRSWSLFGDTTYAVTDQLNLTAGLRFTDDAKRFSWYAPPVSVAGAGKVLTPSQLALFDFLTSPSAIGNIIFTPANVAVERSAEWTNLSPRFVVDYHWTPDVMTYASASYGYKAGGFDSVSINSQFQPEKVANYETGIKSQWFNHKVEANLSGYYYEYTNQQSITLVATAGSLVPQYQTQTGNSDGKGVDAEFVWKPISDLSIHLTEGFLDANWSKRVAPGTILSPIASGPEFNLSGQPTGEPEFHTVIAADYRYDLDSWGGLRFHADYELTSAERNNDLSRYNRAQLVSLVNFNELPGYYKSQNLTDLRVTWNDESDKYEVAFYVNNLFDNRYIATPTDINEITAPSLDTPYVRPNEPRFLGAEFTYRF